MDELYPRTKNTLEAARKHFGYKSQVLIAIGELVELAGVLAKYDRYSTHERALKGLREKVLDECGDVLNSLDHVQAIFEISDEEMVEVAAQKGDRLLRWLQDEGQEITMEDRDVPKKPCPMCKYNGADPFIMPCFACKTKPGFRGFTPKNANT